MTFVFESDDEFVPWIFPLVDLSQDLTLLQCKGSYPLGLVPHPRVCHFGHDLLPGGREKGAVHRAVGADGAVGLAQVLDAVQRVQLAAPTVDEDRELLAERGRARRLSRSPDHHRELFST